VTAREIADAREKKALLPLPLGAIKFPLEVAFLCEPPARFSTAEVPENFAHFMVNRLKDPSSHGMPELLGMAYCFACLQRREMFNQRFADSNIEAVVRLIEICLGDAQTYVAETCSARSEEAYSCDEIVLMNVG
jgi:hypothetical protein